MWYVKSEMYEKAIEFFERAAEIQPAEVKWQLMVTSCYRRMGNFEKALKLYEAIHKQYPDNLECELLLFAACCLLLCGLHHAPFSRLTTPPPNASGLRYLVAICKDLDRKHDHYEAKLVQLERVMSKHVAPGPATGAGGGGGGGGGRFGDGGGEESGGAGGGAGRFGEDEPESPGGPMTAPSGGRFGSDSPARSPGRGGASAADGDEFEDADLDDLLAD